MALRVLRSLKRLPGRGAAAALIAGALLVAPAPRAQEPTWWAVVVGIDQYQSEQMRPLRGAVADAKAIRSALIRHVGVPEQNVTLLVTDGPVKPTKKAILQSLIDLQSKAGDADRLFFFYAGHGVEVERHRFLMTYEAEPGSIADIEDSGLAASQLMQRIEQITLRDRIVMIDACRDDPSPLLRAQPYTAAQSPETVYTIQPTSDGVRATYLSASRGQFAWEWEEIGRGFFSHYVERGLAGGAAFTGQVTVSSLYEYLWAKVPGKVQEQKRQEQTPFHTAVGQLVLVPANRLSVTPAADALSEPRTISGLVTDADARALPATRVRVEIVTSEPPAPISFGPSPPADPVQDRVRVMTTVADERGFYKVFNVVPDAAYRVEAERAGFERTANLSREAGRETPLVLPRVVSAAARAQELALVARRNFLVEDFRAAEATARDALAADPTHVLASAVLGNAMATLAINDRGLSADEKRARLVAARPFVDGAIARDPRSGLALNGRGLIHYGLRAYQSAQQDFARAIDLLRAVDGDRPLEPVARANLGETHLAQERYGNARREFERAVALRPAVSIPYNGLANAHLRLGNWRDAIANARQAIARHRVEDQDLGRFYLTLALGLTQQRKCGEAADALARARILGADEAAVSQLVGACR